MPVTTPRLISSWPARVALAAAGLLATHTGAHAYFQAYLTIGLEGALQVGSSTGNHTWTTVRAGWGASLSNDGTLVRDFQYQAWNGSAWPSTTLSQVIDLPPSGGVGGGWATEPTTNQRPLMGEVGVTGSLGSAQSAGAYILYDFTLELAPLSSVEIQFLEDLSAWWLTSEPGDAGSAYASLSLYSTALGLDEAGGTNQPYFLGLRSLTGGATDIDLQGGMGLMSYTFSNPTNLTQTHALRLEASAQVYTLAVPEPETWALWLAGLGGLGALARRRAARA